ncbi:MAG TPA: VOC family protein [Chloroflexota bacterium]|nr:VOC family protein [Chloroflexota bacterium]
MATQQAVAVKAFDHTVLPVMDLWRAERFYTEVLDGAIFQKVGQTFEEASSGRAAVGTFVKLGRHHVGLFLQHRTKVVPPVSLAEGCPCWGLAVAEEEFADVVQRVRAANVTVGPEQTVSYGGERRRSVRCTDSEGNCLELVADPQGRIDGYRVTGLSHMHVEALELAATVDFYTRFLGAELLEQDAQRAVLKLASGQWWIVHRVEQLSPATIGPYRGRHFAFHVDDETFHAIVARLREAGIEEGDVRGAEPGGQPYVADRLPGELGTYFNDPNGLRLQLLNYDSSRAAAGCPLVRYCAV